MNNIVTIFDDTLWYNTKEYNTKEYNTKRYNTIWYKIYFMKKDQITPFKYGTTVSIASFTNRLEVRKKLYANLLGGINTMIISPRRWGKSSLVEKVFQTISRREKKIRVINIDLFSCSSEVEFLEMFAKEVIKASSNKWQDWMNAGKDFFKQLVPVVSVGIDPSNDFSLSFNWNSLMKHKNEILNLPEVIAKKKGIKLVIGIDEFQNIAEFENYRDLEKAMRAIWQRQKMATYCLYGSKRHMMSEIFNRASNPFYRFGDIIFLDKIKRKDWIKFIVKGFDKTNRTISKEDASLIADMMQNHSWYVQQLSHYTWQRTVETATRKDIEAALIELIYANTPFYLKEVETISRTQLNLLKAIACKEKQFTARSVMLKYSLGTPRNVSKNIDILIKNDIIDRINDRLQFLDPAFELWFMKQYYAVDFRLLVRE